VLHMMMVHKSRDKHSISGNVLRITALFLILLLSAQLVACGSSSGSSGGITPTTGTTPSGGTTPPAGITPTNGTTPSGGTTPPARITPTTRTTPPARITPTTGTTPPARITPTTGTTPSGGTQNGCNNQEATSDCADLSGSPTDYYTTEAGLDHWYNVYPGGEYNAVKEIYFTNTSDSTISWSVAASYETCPAGWASFTPSSGSVPPHTLYADAQSQGYGTHMVLSDASNNLPLDTQSGCTLIVQLTINNASIPIKLYEFIIYVVQPMVSAFTPDATNGTLTMMGQDLNYVQTVTIKVGGQETTSQAPPAGWPSDTITVTLPPGSGTAEVYFTMSCDNNRYENCVPIDAGSFNYPT
jgi:hypothetical protein